MTDESSERDEPASSVGLDGTSHQSAKPRTFTLNSREFYQAVCPPPDPWVWAGGLPREPRLRDRPARSVGLDGTSHPSVIQEGSLPSHLAGEGGAKRRVSC